MTRTAALPAGMTADQILQARLANSLRPVLDGEEAVTVAVVGGEERLHVMPVGTRRGRVLGREMSCYLAQAIAEGFDGAAGSARDALGDIGGDRYAAAAPVAAHGGPAASVELVTPTTAEAWLTANVDNRPLSDSTVTRYSQLMKAGRWMLSTDAVGFDAGGKLVNGQHRLRAVVRSGVSVPMLVVRGLDEGVFAVLDGGRLRSGTDVLTIRGFAYAAHVATVVRLASAAREGQLWRMGGSTRIELDELVRQAEADREALVDAAARATQIYDAGKPSGGHVLLSLTGAAFLIYAYRGADSGTPHERAADVEAYFRRIVTGLGITSATDPAYVVRQAYLDDQRADVGMSRLERLAILIRGAQHVALGQPMEAARGRGRSAWPSLSVVDWPSQDLPRGLSTVANPAVVPTGPADDAEED